MSQVFHHPYTVGLHDSDAAGIIYFPNLLRICHIGSEALLSEIGFSVGMLLKQRTMGLPIVHFEGDFLRYLTVGDPVDIRIRIARIGEKSFTTHYELIAADGQPSARANVVQVCVDPRTGKSMPLPENFRAALQKFA